MSVMESFNLRERTALVTGGGVGLGREIVLALAQAGARIGIHYHRSEQAAAETLNEVRQRGSDGWLFQADLSQEQECNALVNSFVAKARRFDILVNNAGGAVGQYRIEDCPLDVWQKTFAINVTSAFLVTRRAISHLRATGNGSIVNMVSASMQSGGTSGAGAYAAAKGALHIFTRTLAKECGPEIRANAVCPGVIETHHHASTPAEKMAAYHQATPLGRNGQPHEVAMAVLYLVSDASSFTNGAILDVNGGRFLR